MSDSRATPSRRILLLNPNSTASATDRMAVAARAALGPGWTVETATNPDAPPIIADPDGLRRAVRSVPALFRDGLDPAEGVILSAFLDPGLAELAALLPVPVVGIAAAAMDAAAAHGRFTIVTTTSGLRQAIEELAESYGHGDRLTRVLTTEGDPATVMGDPDRLRAALADLIDRAVAEDRPDAVVIGGGPLADAARSLAEAAPVPVIEPVPAAARAIRRRLAGTGDVA